MSYTQVEVWQGSQRDPARLFGPLPGVRHGDALAYEWELPERFEPWPGRTRRQRTFVLLDVGVSLAQPCWARAHNRDGSIVTTDPHGDNAWYVDLLTIDAADDRYVLRDLYLDVIVPTDGRPYRLLDLDEYADALTDGSLTLAQAVDGLRRWQRFFDRYLHAARWPVDGWTDFPPQSIERLIELPAPLGPPVRWTD